MELEQEQITLEKIEKQVERWDLFAKLSPTLFLLIAFLFLLFDLSFFHILFLVGIVFFSITTVVWWFWTLFNIRYLTRFFKKATTNLIEVTEDLKKLKEEYKETKNEANTTQ